MLAPEAKGVFPFLRLPAELRNTINHMIFSLPGEGVAVQLSRSGGRLDLCVARRQEDAFAPDGHRHQFSGLNGCFQLTLSGEDQNLHVLRVEKQVYDEAMPFFIKSDTILLLRDEELTGTALGPLNRSIGATQGFAVRLLARWRTISRRPRQVSSANEQMGELGNGDSPPGYLC